MQGERWMHLSLPLHFWFFDATTLVKLLERHGFSLARAPYSTSRTHHLGVWRNEIRTKGLFEATRRLAWFCKESLKNPDGGDVLRVVAARRSP